MNFRARFLIAASEVMAMATIVAMYVLAFVAFHAA